MGKRGTSRRKVSRLAPKYCEICGYDKVTQRHRIHPGKEGGVYELGNVIALCPNHHAEADREMIPRAVLYYIVQERIRKNGIEEEYKEYLGSCYGVEAARRKPAAESESGVPDSNGNGSNGHQAGAIAERLISYLITEPFRPIPKREHFTGVAGEPAPSKGNGQAGAKGKTWVPADVYK